MANNFSGDTNVHAVYNFESGALTTDSSGKGNTLTNVNTVTENTSEYKQGACSADLESSSSQRFTRADADLSSGFPGKSGDTTKIFGFLGWAKAESLPASGEMRYLVGKYDTGANKRSIAVGVVNNSGVYSLRMLIGYNSGNSGEGINLLNFSAAADKWFHFGVTYRNSDKAYYAKLVLRNSGDTADEETQTGSGNYTNNINIEDAAFSIGDALISGGANSPWDGEIDELVVMNKFLSESNIDAVRNGTYGTASFKPYWVPKRSVIQGGGLR